MNKNITLLTGGSKGIGLNIIKKLLNNNHKIINISRNNCKIINKNIYNYNYDINKINTSKINEILKKFKINNCIINAGITDDKFFHKMKQDEWENVINTNFTKNYSILNPVVNQMRKNNNGNIILVSSVNAKKGALGQTNYSSSKSAMFGFTKSLALENANKNILVNCICPGYINTDMTKIIDTIILKNIKKNIPLGKLGREEDIADLVLHLVEKNKYMTGSIIDINGGLI